MKAIKLSILAAAMLTAGITKAQTADEIMAKHNAAMGTPQAWNNLKTLKMAGSMSQQGMEIGITQTVAVGKAMRMDISVMGMSGFQIVTSSGGWSYMPMMGNTKLDTLKPEMVKAMWEKMDLKGRQMYDYKEKGTKVVLEGKDTIDNIVCYKMKMTEKDGKESTSYMDVNTFYTVRTESIMKVNDQEQEESIVFKNYQKQDGLAFPMSVTTQGAEIVFKSVEVNKPIDDNIFKPVIAK